jgi:hypothetical protein
MIDPVTALVQLAVAAAALAIAMLVTLLNVARRWLKKQNNAILP